MINEERMQILTMLRDHKVSVEEASKLLEALETGEKETTGRNISVRITERGVEKANITIPTGLARMALNVVPKNVLHEQNLDWEEVLSIIHAGKVGKIVEVHQVEEDRHIEIRVE